MKYMGSKSKLAKYIIPFIQLYLKKDIWYFEPFCGGCNMIDKINHDLKLANDSHKYLIDCFKALKYGWHPPRIITEKQYKEIKNNKKGYPSYLVGYVGFNSYGGKWFGGYRRDKENKRDYWKEHYNHMTKQILKLKKVKFSCRDYYEIKPKNAIIYCDPPYNNTTRYKDNFDSNKFWYWVDKYKDNNIIFVSEYNAPSKHKCLWEKEVHNALEKNTGSKKGIEKLYICK